MERVVEMMSGIWMALMMSAPQILSAMGILAAGLGITSAAALVVREVLRRVRIDQHISRDSEVGTIGIADWSARAVFAVGSLMTTARFLEHIGMTSIGLPMSDLVSQMIAYTPTLATGLAVLGAGWGLAVLVRYAATYLLSGLKVHERIGGPLGLSKQEAQRFTVSVPSAGYWLTIALFLPGVAQILKLDAFFAPMNPMASTLLGVIPGLVMACIVLFAGWTIAQIGRAVTTGVSRSFGLDNVADRIGLNEVLDANPLSTTLGSIAHFMVMLTTVVASVRTLNIPSVTGVVDGALAFVTPIVPVALLSIAALAATFLIGRVISRMITSFLHAIGTDGVLERMGVATGKTDLSGFVGHMTFVGIMVSAAFYLAGLFGFAGTATAAATMFAFAAEVAMTLVVVSVALFLADLAGRGLDATGSAHAGTLSQIARVALLLGAAGICLPQMGVTPQLMALGTQALIGAVAIGLAIAIGWGARERVSTWLGSRSTRTAKRTETPLRKVG